MTSIANVLRSNIFDLLGCIPAGVLIAGAVSTNYSVGVPTMDMLALATLLVLLLMRSEMVLTNREAWGLISLYVMFLLRIGVETFGTSFQIFLRPPPGDFKPRPAQGRNS